MSIMRRGVAPDGGLLLKTFGAKRTLALYRTGLSNNWLSLKLVLVVGAAPKGNYVMYWNGERIGGNDFTILKTHQPDVAEDIFKYLKKEFPNLAEIDRIEETEKTARTSEGVPPENGKHIGNILDGDSLGEWQIFSLPESISGNKCVKIVSVARISGRANYALEWNGKRFIRDAGFSRIAERIHLLAAAEEFMENYCEHSGAIEDELGREKYNPEDFY